MDEHFAIQTRVSGRPTTPSSPIQEATPESLAARMKSSCSSSTSPQSSSHLTANTTPPDSPYIASKPARSSFQYDLPRNELLTAFDGGLPAPIVQKIPFKIAKSIGEGCWSKVSCAWTDFAGLTSSLDLRLRAIPELYCLKKPNSKMAERIIYREAQVLTYLLKCPYMTDFVVDFYGFDPDSGSLSMDFVNQDLAKFTANNETMKIHNSHEAAAEIFRGIAHGLVEGLNFLHSCRVIHADIKPSNILIEATPKIGSDEPRQCFAYKALYCDFSAAFLPDLELEPPDSAQTWEYMSPELFKAGAKPMYASDVYALALTLVAGLTGKSPYHIPGVPTVTRQIWAREGDPLAVIQAYHTKANERLLSTGFDRFIKGALCKTPEQRVTVSEWHSRLQKDLSPALDL